MVKYASMYLFFINKSTIAVSENVGYSLISLGYGCCEICGFTSAVDVGTGTAGITGSLSLLFDVVDSVGEIELALVRFF